MTTLIAHTISTCAGTSTATVEAVEHPCGLLVYRVPEWLAWEENSVYPWRIGHRSGVMAAAAVSEQAALDAVAILAPLTDWTADADTLRAAFSGGQPPREIWQQLLDLGVTHPRYR